ncbi:MAG: PaaI family thioesterase [Acidobacteriota bacterium]|nr:PaaI family thioesterase [Acidobacteriota bacterium]
MIGKKSLQETYAPTGVCFGCGVSNEKGLRIRSFAMSDDEAAAEWRAEKHHEAFPGMLSGGITGTLLDCHSNWTAAFHLMKKNNKDAPDCTVTAEYAVKLLRPIPSDAVIKLRARVIESSERKAIVESELEASGEICATCRGTFVAVKPGHPAYHRW